MTGNCRMMHENPPARFVHHRYGGNRSMHRLLFIQQFLYPLFGGAERSTDALIRALTARDDCTVSHVCSNNLGDLNAATLANADTIVTQLMWADMAVDLARKSGKRSVLVVRSHENICNGAQLGDMEAEMILAHCGYNCGTCGFRRTNGLNADLILANSQYMARLIREHHGKDAGVLYPPILAEETRAPYRRPRYITSNQLSYHKGADIILRIADELPHREFRIVGHVTWKPARPIPPNVQVVGRMDTRELFADASLFLAPARWWEPFGRMLIEAQMNGVPVFTSAHGGALEDALVPQRSLIRDHECIDEWVERIEGALARYDEAVALTRSVDLSRFEPERVAADFVNFLERNCAAPLSFTGVDPNLIRIPGAGESYRTSSR